MQFKARGFLIFSERACKLLHQEDGRILVYRGNFFCALKETGWMEPIPAAEVGKYLHVHAEQQQ